TNRGCRRRREASSFDSTGAHRITALAGASDCRISGSLPSRTGPTTASSCATPSCSFQTSLASTVIAGTSLSARQQAVRSRANSGSSVTINTLTFCKETGSQFHLWLTRDRAERSNRRRSEFLGLVQCRKQPLRADAEIHRGFRILCLFGR